VNCDAPQYAVFSSLPLGPSCLFLNALSIWFSLNVRDKVAHPYKNNRQIIVLYILIFVFRSQRGRKDFAPNGKRHSLNLICS
jgi:hypothetical protein